MDKRKIGPCTILSQLLLIVLAFYVIIVTTASRIRNPKWSETQHLIKLFNWSYSGVED